MGYFNIDFSKYAPSNKLKEAPATPSVQERVQANIQKLIPQEQEQGQVQPVQQFTPPQPEPKKGITRKVFDWLAKPSEWTEKLLTKGQGYEKVMEDPQKRELIAYSSTWNPIEEIAKRFTGREKSISQQGVEEMLSTEKGRGVAGTAGRLALDPLNILPFDKIFKWGGKVLSVAGDVTGASKVLRSTKKFVGEMPAVQALSESLSKKFIKGYKLPEVYNILKTEIPTRISKGTQEIVERLTKVFGKAPSVTKKLLGKTEGFWDLSDEAKDAVAKFLEPKTAGAGADLGLLKKTFQESGEWTKIKPMLTEARKTLDAEVLDLVRRGRMPGKTAKELLTQGGYFPHVDFAPKRIKEFFVRPKLGERRTYLTKRKGGTGYTFNAPRAIARRELMQFQDNVVQDFLKEVKDIFGVTVGKGSPVPEGFVPFINPGKRLQELNGWALPTRIAEDLNASLSSGGAIAKAIDQFNSFWKPTATAMNPGFHLTNIFGNLYNIWLAGMKDPLKFLQAVAGNFSPGEKEILEKSGILARGQFGADIVNKTFGSAGDMDVFSTGAKGFFEKFRKVGTFFEDNARSAFLLDRREKFLAQGLSDIEATRKAVQEVNRYLFDYLTGLTPFETNVMRRIFPFYTWARFNIPLQLKSIITQPGKNALVSKVVKELNKGGVPGAEDEEITIPTPFKDADGNPIRYRPNLPVQDIFNINPKRVLSMINPLLKDIPQLAGWALSGGKVAPMDLYTMRGRTDTGLPFGEQVKDVVGSVAKSTLRPVRSFTKLEAEPTMGSFVRNFLMGGFYPVKKQSEEFRTIGEKTKRNSAIREKMRQVRGDSSMTVKEKREEISRLMKLLK